MIIAVICNLSYNPVTIDRPHSLPAWNKNIIAKLLIIRDYKAIIFVLLENTGYLRETTLNDLKHLSFSPLGRSCTIRRDSRCHQLDQNRIPMKGTLRLICRNKNILLHPFNSHKSKTSRTAAEFSRQRIRLSLLVSTILCQHQFTAGDQLIKKFLEFFFFTFRH